MEGWLKIVVKEETMEASGVRENRHRLQQAIRSAAFGLTRGRTVEHPDGALFQGALEIVANHRLASHVLRRFVAVQPDVLQLRFFVHKNRPLPIRGGI